MQGRGGFANRAIWATSVVCILFACGDTKSDGSEPGDSDSGGGGGSGGSEGGASGSAGTAGNAGKSVGGGGGDSGGGGDAGSTDDDGAGNGGAVAGNGGAGGEAGGEAGAGSGGRPITSTVTCAAPEDATRWHAGNILYVDDDPGCGGLEPCYPLIINAVRAASSGDTIAVLPGTHYGADIEQNAELSSLRITALEGPDVTVISNSCFKITGWMHDPGQIWIDNFTIRDCGGAGGLVDQGWGIYVSSSYDTDVRIQDNVFQGVFGRGGVGLWSSYVRTRFHAVVARNRFTDHHGEESALDIDLPADSDEDYCVRIENNVVEKSDSALGIFYTRFRDGEGKFEIANNTFYGNELGVSLSGPSGVYTFVNNIIFNTEDFTFTAEMSDPFDVRSNLIGSGQFSGLSGNFAADPLFEDAETGDYRLRGASPAADRGDLRGTALEDISGTPRTDPPDLGAYERTEPAGQRLDGLRCGDGVVQRGPVSTSQGEFLGFESCEDGNARNGDGCSSLCQFEPAPPRAQISLQGTHLCVIRANGSLQCWGEDEQSLPTGSFQQVALSGYHGCALRDDGGVNCWRTTTPTTSFAPTGTFTQIDGDYDQTCGLRENGSITCWDDTTITLDEPGPYVRVDTNYRACGLSAAGDATCYEPYSSFPSGPFVQLLPSNNTAGCGLRPSGELVCLPGGSFFMAQAPDAGLTQVHADQTRGCGLRPDGRAVYWVSGSGVRLLLQEEAFLEVVPGFNFCCGITLDRRAWCSQNSYGLPAE